MKIINNYMRAFKKFGEFGGRATRFEFWTFILSNILIMSLLSLTGIYIFVGIFALAICLPSLAITIRRLHDTNKSGWLYLIVLIPFASIVLFVFYLLPSDKGRNNYGELDVENEGASIVA